MSNLLPPNATLQEKAIAATITDRQDAIPVKLRDLWDPQTCPANLLPWLAWCLSLDIWDPKWAESIKRDVIAESLKLTRHKGTPWAVEQAIIKAGSPNARVLEWFEYGGQPFHFKVEVDAYGETPPNDTVTRMNASIEAHKNVRSHMEGEIIFNLSVKSPIYWGVGLQSSEMTTVYPKPVA